MAREITGVGVTPSSRWMKVSIRLAGEDFERGALCGAGQRMGVFADEERAVDAVSAPVIADGLSDGQDVRLGEGAVERGATMAAGAEVDQLVGVGRVGPALVVIAFEPGQIHQQLRRGRFTCKW